MIILRLAVLLFCCTVPVLAHAAVAAGDLPGNAVWYVHADLEAMRASESGGIIYRWFEREVVVEINEELNIDLNEELDAITAFSDNDLGTVIVMDGPLAKSTQDRILAFVSAGKDIDQRSYDGKDYFFMGDEEPDRGDNNDPFDDLEDAAYFSFALNNRAIITADEQQMQALLENGGRVAGSGSHDGAVFVMSAEASFVQAGLRTDEFADDEGDDWESNIIRNTRQAALLVSDADGLIAVEAQLVSTDPKMASAIGGIVNGLIALQSFNSELQPEVQDLIRNTKVEVNENTLSINTVVDPELVVSIMDE